MPFQLKNVKEFEITTNYILLIFNYQAAENLISIEQDIIFRKLSYTVEGLYLAYTIGMIGVASDPSLQKTQYPQTSASTKSL